MPNDPVINGDLHEEAERILAERNRARGQAPGDYTVDEYVEAKGGHEAPRRSSACAKRY